MAMDRLSVKSRKSPLVSIYNLILLSIILSLSRERCLSSVSAFPGQISMMATRPHSPPKSKLSASRTLQQPKRKTNKPNSIKGKSKSDPGKRPFMKSKFQQKGTTPRPTTLKPKTKPVFIKLSNEELDSLSIGEAITKCHSPQQCLHIASRLWVPIDDNLPPHYLQGIHHEKRQRWASLLIEKLYSTTLSSDFEPDNASTDPMSSFLFDLWQDPRMIRMLLACAMPFRNSNDDSWFEFDSDRANKEGRYVTQALWAIHALLAYSTTKCSPYSYTSVITTTESSSSENIQYKCLSVNKDILRAIQILIQRTENMAMSLQLREAIEARWAIRGILARLVDLEMIPNHLHFTLNRKPFISAESLNEEILSTLFVNIVPSGATDNAYHSTGVSMNEKEWNNYLTDCLPRLEKRVSNLPFDIIPSALDWARVLPSPKGDKKANENIPSLLLQSIPFQFDTITTRTGDAIQERRQTAWVTEQSIPNKQIGALAYSGKLMPPHPLPSIVRKAMRLVERSVLDETSYDNEYQHDYASNEEEQTGYFDCALCNHYPDNDAACKFHTDPEHGTFWERLTCVVAAGEERRFAFRPIPGLTRWEEWDFLEKDNDGFKSDGEGNKPAIIHLFSGDIVKMVGTCNDDFHHAVYNALKEEDDHKRNQENEVGRVSLVFKRAMVRGNGKRGHGMQGEGRRSRKKSQ